MARLRLIPLLLAVGLGSSTSLAAPPPFGGAPAGVPSATALAVQCPNGTTSCFGGGANATSITPSALSPSTIVAAGAYQQVAKPGAAATNGGFVQPAATNTGLICVDVSSAASSLRTTPSGGQICQTAIGSTAPITFPATAGAVYVFGTVRGDAYSGSVS